MAIPCDTCSGVRSALAQLQSRPIRIASGRATRPETVGWHKAICGPCLQWLATTVTDVRLGSMPAEHIGVPEAAGPPNEQTGACHLCHASAGDSATIVEGRHLSDGASLWPPLLLCRPCDGWVGSLATSGSTIRGVRSRLIDGPYGKWLHPNLRRLRMTFDCASKASRAALTEACAGMEMGVERASAPEDGAVHVCDAARATRALTRSPGSPVIALAPFSGEEAVRAALASGAREWITEPPTPQQITAALVRLVAPGPARLFDSVSCLPRIMAPEGLPAAIRVIPRPGVTPFQAAWLLRRFARGYDETGALGDAIVLMPRVAEEHLESVVKRLADLLQGSCDVLAMPRGTSRTPRIDAAA